MNFSKQILIAGMVGIYDTGGVVKNIDNFEYVIDNFLTVKAHLFMDYLDSYNQFVRDMIRWRSEGSLHQKVQIFEGIDSARGCLGCSI